MKKRDQAPLTDKKRYPNYGRVLISSLKNSRKGKHHELLLKIMEDLVGSAAEFAVKIPLASTGGVSLLNLRSAVVREAQKRKLNIATSSDDTNFYVWRVPS